MFDDLMDRLLRGRSKTPRPPVVPRIVSIQFPVERVIPLEDGRCRLRAAVRLSLSEHLQVQSSEVEIKIGYAFASDAAGRSSEDYAALELGLPAGFTAAGSANGVHILRGLLGHAHTTVQVESEPYEADWTGELRVSADLVAPELGADDGD